MRLDAISLKFELSKLLCLGHTSLTLAITHSADMFSPSMLRLRLSARKVNSIIQFLLEVETIFSRFPRLDLMVAF